jgi:hypothetical protein
MAIYDFFLSRNNGPTVDNYVGHAGRLFYDSAERILRISDGTTAGGEVFNGLITVANTEPTDNFQGQIWLNPQTFELSVYHNGNFIPTIDVATSTKLGGIKLGPGVTVNGEGQLIIDSEGLDFSFGDFAAITGLYSDSTAYALLSSINADEDIVIASNGDGAVKVVGQFDIYKTNGTVTGSLEDAEPFFRVKEDGQVRILVPLADTTEGGVEIIGSLLGTALEPGIAGTMLHLTGNAGESTRVYHDTLSDYSSYVFRRYNGSVITPTQVLANEDIGRINFTAATNAGMGNVALAQIRVTALENQTPTAQGSSMTFTLTPAGSAASARVNALVIKGTGIELPTAGTTVKLSGSSSGTITVQAAATAGTNTITLPAATGTVVTTGDTATVTNTMLAGSIANAKLANSTISGIALGGTLAALSPGNYLTGSDYNGSTVRTFAVDATTTNTASKVVARDASGNFAAGTITANLTGTASTATNLAAATSILAGTLAIDPGNINKNTSSTQTFTLNGLTTSHKIIITPATVMPDRQYAIRGAWASATNTLSVEIVNNSGGNIDAGTINLSYIAFV